MQQEHKIIDGIDNKICNKHHIYFPNEDPYYPSTEEYFYKNKNNTLCYHCRKCNNAIRRPDSKRRKTIYKKPSMINIPKNLRRVYINMIQRCYNLKNPAYKDYGGRGINICSEWLDDRYNFFKWSLDNGYSKELEIDRVNVNGNYEPTNCRWTTDKVQANNRRDTIYLEIEGVIKPLQEWSGQLGINPIALKNRVLKYPEEDVYNYYKHIIKIEIDGEIKTLKELSQEKDISYELLRHRLYNGCKLENLFKKPIKKGEIKQIEINGEVHTVSEWAKISGLDRNVILSRISYGWNNEDLLIPKKRKYDKKYIEIDGEFHTKDEWCEIMDINVSAFYRRLKRKANLK